jgi:hypothetical protein
MPALSRRAKHRFSSCAGVLQTPLEKKKRVIVNWFNNMKFFRNVN